MQKTKKIFSLLLAVLMVVGCMSALPLSGVAAVYKSTPAGNSVTAADEAEGGLIVSFSKLVSDRKIEKTIAAEDAAVESIDTIGSLKLATVSVEADAAQTADALAENNCVKAVQPNYRYQVYGDDPYIGEGVYASNQYQFAATRAFEAWDELEGGFHGKTRVAVVDTGIDLNHEDLQKNVIKQDGKYAHFAYGDLEMIDDDIDVEDGHGTHVSGIIAATYGNDIGGSGIASGHENNLVELMTVGASADGYGLYSIDIVKAIDYAVKNGARVINMSFGSAVRDLLMDSVIQNAYYNEGVAFVAASGNEDDNGYSSPSDLKEVLSVNASNRFDQATYFSNYGPEKDISAPGGNVLSTLPGDNYGNMSGTSMASPVAAGIAALVLDANPNLTPAQVYNIMCASAKRADDAEEIYDDELACGIVDAYAAVKAAKAASADTPVEAVKMKSEKITVVQKNTYGAEAVVLPAASLAPVVWSIADPAVATIDPQTGIITALNEGETTITATAGGKSATQTLVVEPIIELTDIEVKGIPEDGMVGIGENIMVEAKFVPTDATFTDYYVKSSDDEILAASDGMLIAKKAGNVSVSVESWDGAIKKTFDLSVKNTPWSVEFTKKAKWMFTGESVNFSAKALDEDGSDDVAKGQIVYSSSNKKILEVDENTGKVKALEPGKAFVIAFNEYSLEKAAVQVTVAKTDYKGKDYALKQTKATKDSVSLSWNAVPVASGYQIDYQTKSGGAWKPLATVGSNKTAYKHTKLKAGTVYYYKVTALYKKNGAVKAFSSSNTIDAKTTADYKLKQTAKTKTSVSLRWSKAPSAAGYEIQYKANASAKWKTIKSVGAKTFTYTHKGLKAGKTMYYRVRAFYKVSGKVKYFEYSDALQAKSAK